MGRLLVIVYSIYILAFKYLVILSGRVQPAYQCDPQSGKLFTLMFQHSDRNVLQHRVFGKEIIREK